MSDIIKGSEINSAGYGIIPKLAMQDLDLDIGAKAVYAYFCSFAGAGDTCFPSREKICNDLRVSKNTLTKYITQLVKRGYLDVEQSKGNGRFANNVYTLRSEIEPCTKKQDTVQPDTKKPCTKISNTENLGYENLTPNNNSNKNNTNNTQKTHKVVKGDSLWAIAQKHYGKGSLYPKIKEANKSKYKSLAKNNIIYVNWELIIP